RGIAQVAPVIALFLRRIIVDLEEEPPDAGFERSLDNPAVIATHEGRKRSDLPLDGANRIHPGIDIGRPADTHPAAAPEVSIRSEVELPPDRNVVRIQVVLVAVPEHFQRTEEVSTAVRAVVYRNAAIEAVGMRVDIGNEEVMHADRVAPVRRPSAACG